MGGLKISLLTPVRSIPGKDVGGAGLDNGIIGLAAIHPIRVAVLTTCPNDNRIGRDGHGAAEIVKGVGVGAFEISLLTPV